MSQTASLSNTMVTITGESELDPESVQCHSTHKIHIPSKTRSHFQTQSGSHRDSDSDSDSDSQRPVTVKVTLAAKQCHSEAEKDPKHLLARFRKILNRSASIAKLPDSQTWLAGSGPAAGPDTSSHKPTSDSAFASTSATVLKQQEECTKINSAAPGSGNYNSYNCTVPTLALPKHSPTPSHKDGALSWQSSPSGTPRPLVDQAQEDQVIDVSLPDFLKHLTTPRQDDTHWLKYLAEFSQGNADEDTVQDNDDHGHHDNHHDNHDDSKPSPGPTELASIPACPSPMLSPHSVTSSKVSARSKPDMTVEELHGVIAQLVSENHTLSKENTILKQHKQHSIAENESLKQRLEMFEHELQVSTLSQQATAQELQDICVSLPGSGPDDGMEEQHITLSSAIEASMCAKYEKEMERLKTLRRESNIRAHTLAQEKHELRQALERARRAQHDHQKPSRRKHWY
jgi:hypothetical protein